MNTLEFHIRIELNNFFKLAIYYTDVRTDYGSYFVITYRTGETTQYIRRKRKKREKKKRKN